VSNGILVVGPNCDDDQWHVVFIVQRMNDNPEGVELYFDSRDGVETPKEAGSTANASFLNQHIGNIAPNATRLGLCANAATSLTTMLQGFTGEMDYFAVFDEALTGEDIGRLTRKYLDGTQ
jgi:hypothetical protein